MPINPNNVSYLNKPLYLTTGEPVDAKFKIASLLYLGDIAPAYVGHIFYSELENKHYKVTSVKDGYLDYQSNLVVSQQPLGDEYVDWELVEGYFIDGYEELVDSGIYEKLVEYGNINSANLDLPTGYWWGYIDEVGEVVKITLNCSRVGTIQVGVFNKANPTNTPSEVFSFTSVQIGIQTFTLPRSVDTSEECLFITDGVYYYVETNTKTHQVIGGNFQAEPNVRLGFNLIVLAEKSNRLDYLKTREIVVSKTGDGDFTNINDAIITAQQEGGVFGIKVMPGTYYESVKVIGMTGQISLYGVDKELCVIQMDFNDYYNPPLDVSGEIYISNLSFVATNTQGAASIPMYAVHADFPGTGTTEFFNCYFRSFTNNHCIGAGSHVNQTLRFRNCKFFETSPTTTSVASIYWHNAVANGVINQKLEVIDCEIYTQNNTPLSIHDANQTVGTGGGGESSILFLGNTFYSFTTGIVDPIIRIETTRAPGAFVGNIILYESSNGNNLEELNVGYSAENIVNKAFEETVTIETLGRDLLHTNATPSTYSATNLYNLVWFEGQQGRLKKFNIWSGNVTTLNWHIINYNPATQSYTVKKNFSNTLSVGDNTITVDEDFAFGDTIAISPANMIVGYTDGSSDIFYVDGSVNPWISKNPGYLAYTFEVEVTTGSYTVETIKETLDKVNESDFGTSSVYDRISLEGQSNCLGVGYSSGLSSAPFNSVQYDYTKEFDRVFIFNQYTNNYEKLKIGVNNISAWDSRYTSGTPIPESTFGVELGIAISWLNANPKGLLFIDKNVGDGQPISYFQKGGAYYTQVETNKAFADEWLNNRGIKTKNAGFVWVQGEGDMAQSETYYRTQLDILISDRVTDGLLNSNTKIILAQIPASSLNYGVGVSDAKTSFTADNINARLITYTNNYNPDQIHLNTTGQMQLGFDAYKQVADSDTEKTTAMPIGKETWTV